MTTTQLKELIKKVTETAHTHGWFIYWERRLDGLTVGEKLDLIHTELGEATEAYRDNNFEGFSEEIADTLIRIFHLIGDLHIDIEKHLSVKMVQNEKRPFKHGRIHY